MTCPSVETLGVHARGHTATIDAPSLDAHLAGCSSCREVFAAADTKSERTFSAGESFGRYRVEGVLGRGGMGVVVRAEDPELGRSVALKLLRGCGGTRRVDALLAEARAMARLTHPNVVAVLDVGMHGDEAFLAMEYVDGPTLRAWLDETPRTTSDIVAAFVAAGRGLEAAHRAGLVHRDFKPENVLVGRDGRVRVTDFGIAQFAAGDDDAETPGETPREPLVGTPKYMAPEQLDGGVADARTDLFSFCVALYEAVSGELPFFPDPRSGGPLREHGLRLRPRPATLPRWLAKVLARGLVAGPADRYPGMAPLLDELLAVPRRRRAFVVSLLVGVASLTLIAGAYRVRRVEPPTCSAGPERLATVWNDGRKKTIAAAFARSDQSYAADAYTSVERAIDEYGRRWVARYTDACVATHGRGDQSQEVLDLRMQCLDQRLRGVDGLAELLTRADGSVVAAMYKSPVALEQLERCDNPEELKAEVRPPSDAAHAAVVDAVQKELASVRAQHMTKQVDRLAKAEGLAEQAVGCGYAPLEADVLLLEGRLLADERRFEEAERVLLRGAARAEVGRADGVRASIWIELCSLAARQGQYPRAHQHAAYAGAVVERAGRRADLAAALASADGWAYFRGGDYPAATKQLERARDLYEHTVEDPIELIRVLRRLGATALEAGDLPAAERVLEHALSLGEHALGAEHPELAGVLEELGYVSRDRDDHTTALKLFSRSLDIQSRVDGVDSPVTVVAKSAIALTNMDLGRFALAEPTYRAMLEQDARTLPKGSPESRQALTNLGLALNGQWRFAEAIVQLRLALDTALANFPKDGDVVLRTRTDLAEALLGAGELREAETLARAAVEAQSKPDEAWAEAPRTLGEVLLAARRPREALPFFEAAIATNEKDAGTEHSLLVQPLLGLGEAARLTGDAPRALAVLERALVLSDKKPRRSWLRGAVRILLARVLTDLGRDPERARALVAEAQPFFAADGGAAHALR